MEQAKIVARAKEYIAQETDAHFKQEVEVLLQNSDWKELEDRFYRDLEFGTGGLRGVIGGGFNRMNLLVVQRATQGMADYLIKTFPGKKLSACVAYDSRNYSKEFSEATAQVFAANGIKTYLFTSLRPTPELSYAIRYYKADTGVVVTASHNPPKYNGYKAYWNDGAQVIPPHDVGIIECVEKVHSVKLVSMSEALKNGLIVMIDKEIDEPYIKMVKDQMQRPELFKKMASSVKLVYTPLHGTGAMLFERVMNDLGLKVSTVQEQREPDGNFPTVAFPNPEEAAALKLALELGKKEKADCVMATDPDADRFGCAVPNKQGEFVLISGNQLGVLHLDYILHTLKELGRMPKKPAAVKSIVTTEMQGYVARAYGAEMIECLTGFKWIADVMNRLEREGKDYVYGTEESYGHCVEKEIRDKDGISAAALTAEMTLYWRSQNKSLLDRLDELYIQHGYFGEKGLNKYFEGASGMETMKNIMATYRNNVPTEFGGVAVVKVRDLKTGFVWETKNTNAKTATGLPPSDVIQWYLADGTLVTVRPSGTEPKIKFYILGRTEVQGKDAAALAAARTASDKKLLAIEADIKKVIS